MLFLKIIGARATMKPLGEGSLLKLWGQVRDRYLTPLFIFDPVIFFTKGVDFLSQGVVRSYFRESSAMFILTETELVWLKRVEIPGHPLRADACAGLKPAAISSKEGI